jgi:hypothetical protein
MLREQVLLVRSSPESSARELRRRLNALSSSSSVRGGEQRRASERELKRGFTPA